MLMLMTQMLITMITSEKKSMPMCITYRAVRDKNGNYLGTAEFVQNMTFAKNYFTKGE